VAKEHGGLVMEKLIEKENHQFMMVHDDKEKLILEAIADFVIRNLPEYEKFLKEENAEIHSNLR